jgi:hypothetical protein
MRTAQKLLGAPTIGRGSAWAGVMVEGVKGGKKASTPVKIHKKGVENEKFPALSTLKSMKMPFFTQKYLVF